VTKSKLTGLRFRSSIAQHRYSIAESEVIARARSSIRSERSTPSTAGRTVLAHPTAVMTKAASQVEHSTPHQWRQERPQCGPFHRRVGVSLGTAQRLVACEELRIIIDVLFHEARTSKCLPSRLIVGDVLIADFSPRPAHTIPDCGRWAESIWGGERQEQTRGASQGGRRRNC
jgi:hypothetical protein